MTPRTSRLFDVEWAETSDDYYTPAWVFERLGLHFALDVAAPPGGVPWIPCDRYFTESDDGLAQDWYGLVWCNPPYSQASPWVRRLIEHRAAVALLPLVDSNWLDELWHHATGVTLLPRDMRFVRPNQKEQRIMFRTALWAFGSEALAALHRFAPDNVREGVGV